MLEKYLEMFEDEVTQIKDAGIDDIPALLKKNQEKIVLFENVNGYSIVGNLWARRERFSRVLGKNLILNFLNAIEHPMDYQISNMDMHSKKISLDNIPFPKYYKKDGGRYITSGVVFSKYGGKRNASFHRIMIIDDKHGAIRLVPRDLYRMHKDAMDHGEEVKVAVAIGLEPHVLLAGATSTNYSIDELKIASSLSYLTRGETEKVMIMPNGIAVPYNSEIVLEGKITDEFVNEGPFVDITGTYDIVRKQPVIEFDNLYYHKKILHLLLSGGKEHYNLMGMPREPTIYREIKKEGVDVLDVRLTPGGCAWLHAAVKINKKNENDGRKAIYGAFKGHHSLKHVVVVDRDIDIDNPEDVEFALATRFQGDRDLIKMGPTRGSSLDPSAYEGHMTIKLGFDATMPLQRREDFIRVK